MREINEINTNASRGSMNTHDEQIDMYSGTDNIHNFNGSLSKGICDHILTHTMVLNSAQNYHNRLYIGSEY
jgi:hypothetical protein